MKLYPAIDLKDGQCVRLLKGNMDQATVYNENAAAQAAAFEKMGFDYLHIVDLNGAIEGDSVNFAQVKHILRTTNMKVQLGGGIRTGGSVARWLEVGISRVILGTSAVKNPTFVKDMAKKYPGQIIVGIDARNGLVATEGWVETSKVKAVDLAQHFQDAGVAAIIYTDISRDGTLDGPNLKETVEIAKAVEIPVILSGGISKLEDIQEAKSWGCLDGIIIGRALYEKTIDPAEALRVAR